MSADENQWYWTSVGVSIEIPDEYVLTVLRMMLIEKLKVRISLMAKTIDGGKEIRLPMTFK